jgi:CRISPR-associated protein Csx10
MRLFYTLTTIDPVIVSQSNTTTNNHECLDYIPGSAVLGLLASIHYNNFTEQQSWFAFHSGECRFSPCYPIVGGQLCLPIPLSWHYGKGDDVSLSEGYNLSAISNHAAPAFERDQGKQYKQCRVGYINGDGLAADVQRGLSTKTAIDRLSGTASDGQLFSYAFIAAGQTFGGWLDCSDEALLAKLKSSLSQTHRIGRSRNTEFGRVKLSLSDTLNKVSEAPTKSLVLWCLSDCELLNSAGMPILVPTGEDIHPLLKTFTLNKAKSFIRSHKVSRFNQKRQGYDSEQVLVTKGSVLVFESKNSAIAPEVLAAIAEHGIGINRQQGLGWVMVNPNWAKSAGLEEKALFDGIIIAPQVTKSIIEQPASDSILLAWVEEQQGLAKAMFDSQQEVSDLLQSIYDCYRNGRRYNNIINTNEAGPSASQWRRIADKVRASNQDWARGVFDGDEAICKADNDELGWGIKWHNGSEQIDFATEIKMLLATRNVATMRLLLEKLCRFDISTYRGLKDFSNEYQLDNSTRHYSLRSEVKV